MSLVSFVFLSQIIFPYAREMETSEQKGIKGGKCLSTAECLPGLSLDHSCMCFDFVSIFPPEICCILEANLPV